MSVNADGKGTYVVEVSGGFCATHRVCLADGSLESLHGHDWVVTVELRSEALDDCGMVADFLAVREGLDAVSEALNHRCLNDHEWLEGMSPTAERVARVILEHLGRGASWRDKIHAVHVVEAPGCRASFLAASK